MRRIIIHIIYVLLFLILISCSGKRENFDNRNIFGTYIFEYPSNEIEELVLKEDSTYIKNIYLNKENFIKSSKPIYSNIGKWHNNPRNEKLDFKDWLSYCEMGNPNKVLKQPKITYMMGVSWLPPSFNDDGSILIYDQTNYIFKRLNKKDKKSR